MSSEQEESAEHPDESNTNPNISVEDQTLDSKGNGLKEHAKPRRRRRGKKRKHKKESAATCEAENHDECESELHVESEYENHLDCESPVWDSEEDLSCDLTALTDVIIRPLNVPKAPLNSTQFIIDDHDDCRFYMSFETPNPYLADPQHDGEDGDIIEPVGEDAAYIDIDYQYESPQDFDNSAYYDKEFELSYKNNRFEELTRVPRAELLNKLQSLESRLKELSEDLVKENPSPVLEKLQADLLELQEKNSYLKQCNSNLKTMLFENETDCSPNETVCQSLAENVSRLHEDQEEGTDGEVYEDCTETADVISPDNSLKDVTGIYEECIKEADVVMSDTSNEISKRNCSNSHSRPNNTDDKKLFPEQSDSVECTLDSAKISRSGDEQTKILNSNSIVYCKPNNIVEDELRTLSVTSDLFNLSKQTKCSSSVPLEGGVSPSETSVN